MMSDFRYEVRNNKTKKIERYNHIMPFSSSEKSLPLYSHILIAESKGNNEVWLLDDPDKGVKELKKFYREVTTDITYVISKIIPQEIPKIPTVVKK